MLLTELIETVLNQAGHANLMEADNRHGPLVQLLLKVLGHPQLLCAEAVVSEQHTDLHSYLDQVFDHFLGHRSIARVLFGDAVEFVQDFAGGVVDEHLDGGFGGHAAEDLLLCLHGHVLGTEGLHGYLEDIKKLEGGFAFQVSLDEERLRNYSGH